MEKERKIKYLSLAALVIAVLGLTIAFAAMSEMLTINGNASMNTATWDVHFENLSDVTLKGDAKETSKPNISPDGLFVENINISLTKPKDEATYTVDVVNKGSINAEITSIEKSPITDEQAKIFEFDVRYKDGGNIEESNILAKGEKEEVVIKLRFKDDIDASDLPKTSQSINLSLKINYVQADDKALPPGGGDTTKTYEVGEEVCLGSECFYVIKDNGNSVTALSKYNLLVGNEVKFKEGSYTSIVEEIAPISTTTEGYGLQNSKALGVSIYETTAIGTIEFSSTDYWQDYEQVFNSNSSLYNYVKNYESYLKRRGYKSISSRLITTEELDELKCNGRSCNDAPDFIKSTSYWTGSSSWASDIFAMLSASGPDPMKYSLDCYYGVRPIITISKFEI